MLKHFCPSNLSSSARLDGQKQSFLFPWDSKWPPRDKGLLVATVYNFQYGDRRGAAMKGVTRNITNYAVKFIELVLCLLYNRLWDYGIETEMYGRNCPRPKLL